MLTADQQRAVLPFKEPHALYVSGEDNLRTLSYNSVASVELSISGRFLSVEGRVTPFRFRHVCNSDRTVKATIDKLGEGWILGLSVLVLGAAPIWGQTWARVEIARGFDGDLTALQVVTSGLVTATQRLSYPGRPPAHPLELPGAIRRLTGTNPAAGAEISETVPVGARWRLLVWHGALATDATVSNRTARLTFDDGTTVYVRASNAFAHTASTTNLYTAGEGLNSISTLGASLHIPLPAGHRLLAGHRVRSSTFNLQATDDWSAPEMLVEEWLEA